MTHPSPIPLDPAAITSMMEAVLKADNCSDDEATVVANHLTEASLRGHDSHGIIRITRYHEWLNDGTMHPRTALTEVTDAGPLLQFDGNHGVGQWLAGEAARAGIARAKRDGAAIVALRRAGHVGRLGTYAEMACEEGLVSIQFCNVTGSSLVAPFGAAERWISTAPVAVGVPNASGDDFILDFATSFVAEGKALVAAQGGRALPPEALVDGEGQLTGDPRALYGKSYDSPSPDPCMGEGALRTMGEHKGSGLALACELLAGALTGNGTNGPDGRPFGNGWLAIFMDPSRLNDTGTFGSEVADYVSAVQGARPAQGVERVLIPGDKERATRAERLAGGLPVAPRLLDALIALSDELGLGATRASLQKET